MSIFEKNKALQGMWQEHGKRLSSEEDLGRREDVASLISSGSMVLLGNPHHKHVRPVLVGQPASIKVNANIGTSPFVCEVEQELRKLDVAVQAGAHTVMDLSIGGDLTAIRREILSRTQVPVGTVPIYGVAQKYINNKKDPAEMTAQELFEEIENQAEQGVDFMTIHCGVTRRSADMARSGRRILGIVSRGGSLTAKWMQENNKENPLYEHFDKVIEIARKHNVVLSLGDGIRPGAGADAGDPAQWEEVIVLGELAQRALESGVQVMIEGPGHVPLHQVEAQIRGIKQLCNNAPLYVLGPLTTDIAAGYDHIAGAIGGALAGYNGADFLCYLTPAEHLTLPDEEDVTQGVKASLLAAHSAEVALGRKAAVQRNNAMSKARKDLDWAAMKQNALDPDMFEKRRQGFEAKEECAMCGEFCAVKLLR